MITDYLKLCVCVYVLCERVCHFFFIFKLNLGRVTYIIHKHFTHSKLKVCLETCVGYSFTFKACF